MEEWQRKQIERARAAAERISNEDIFTRRAEEISDKVKTLHVLSEDVSTIEAFVERINQLFSDNGDANSKVICSTVHRAKGTESRRVFVLADTLYINGNVVTGEERNIHYVAITRSMNELFFVEMEHGSSSWLRNLGCNYDWAHQG